eukprot:209915_1
MKSGCCTICLEPLFKDIQVSSQCGHVFHRSCIYRWIDSANTCPNCKQHCDASQLTNLFLDPLEIIKEVLGDPTVLQNVDPELLLQIYQTDSTKCAPHEEDDMDLEILDLKNNRKPKQSKKANHHMELIQERIKNSALTTKHEELSTKLCAVTGDLRDAQDEQSKLHRKMQSYLKSAQSYERKFVDQEDQVKKLNIELFKKNKELITKKKEIDRLLRKHAQHEHQENIMIGNMNAVHEMEMKVSESGKSKEEQAAYWKSMYDWIKKEYMQSQSDKQRDKKSHQTQQKKWSEIHEEQRLQIKTLERCGMENLEKINKYKKVYFKLKDKYTKQRLQLQELYKQKKNRETAVINEASDHGQEEDEVVSISNDENQENIAAMVQENEKEDEDDDLHTAAMNVHAIDSVFSYPQSKSYRPRNATSNSLFNAYHELQSKKDGRNPFSSQMNQRNRKRNFSQLTKGDDGRGGVQTYLTDGSSNYNRRKRRRVVKTSSNANNKRNGNKNS